MNLKLRTFFYMVLAMVSMFLFSSCLKNEDDKRTYSAAEEIALRNTYLNNLVNEGYDIDTTENGVYYVVMDEGTGDFAKQGDTLTVAYVGYFIDGTPFDTSLGRGDGKYTFILGVTSLISGWNEGMKVMNKGSKIQFIIPSEHAYKSTGYLSVPPYQTLVFVIELFDINPS